MEGNSIAGATKYSTKKNDKKYSSMPSAWKILKQLGLELKDIKEKS